MAVEVDGDSGLRKVHDGEFLTAETAEVELIGRMAFPVEAAVVDVVVKMLIADVTG